MSTSTDRPSVPDRDAAGALDGVRVVEFADERAEYTGLLLAGLGAEVIKVEPPQGSPTRCVGPFVADIPGPDRSLFFAAHNRAKQSVSVEVEDPAQRSALTDLIGSADIFLESTDVGFLDERGLSNGSLTERFPHLIVARMTAFGDTGPWSGFKGSDLVHLALGGPMMNCGYDPEPGGYYDIPPIAPQLWQSLVIAGEQLTIGILAALVHQGRTGSGQSVTCAIHEAVAKSTELDLMNWIMRRAPMYRQTCRHAAERVSALPTISQTKDGRWVLVMPVGAKDHERVHQFLARYGVTGEESVADAALQEGRSIPGSSRQSARDIRLIELVQRLARKFSYDDFPWQEAQEAGIACSPLRKPHENVADPHWQARGTFAEIAHPEIGATLTYPVRKWLSTEPAWRIGSRAPRVGEHSRSVWTELARTRPRSEAPKSMARPLQAGPPHGRPMALDGVRILDFTWFLASAGGTRFLSAFGAECIKVEWKSNPDTRIAAMAPVGGREARARATEPLPGVTDPDMGGQFNNKNPGKRGLSLNVRHPRGLEIARRLVAISDIVAEGFSPGVMDRWGLGYEQLRAIRPDVIYAQQSGMGTVGEYGRYRAVGPIAAALAGVSEMSGLPEPAMPAGWGYSYLDWIGAYSFSVAMLTALHYRDRTGRGQWIDASQTESGIFLASGAILDWSANGRSFTRTGNASVDDSIHPQGVYPCLGTDRWLAISCRSDVEREALAKVLGLNGVHELSTRSAAGHGTRAYQSEPEITEWTLRHDAYEAMYLLQAAGVPAGVCQDARDRVDADPQLAHLNWLTEVTGTKIGRWPVANVPSKLSATPAHIGGTLDRGAPCYGEDNEWVLGELLGFGTREIAELEADGVI
jgi:crotonobetainyl-CoA:carnitine CoA-transferase CaiB-like acyl-CoA transferase